MRPLIGITIDHHDDGDKYESPFTYALSVEKAGGLPVLLPYQTDVSLVGEYVDRCAGFLFTGGNDMDPAAWGEARHAKAIPMDPARERFERALLAEVERRRVPALGVCFGSQLMNVYRGGSLHQFLPDLPRDPMLEHRKVGGVLLRHDVKIDPGSQLHATIGKEQVSANTYHKQAINRLGRGLVVTARVPDGVIEAFEDPAFPLFLAVQWHPERLHEEREHLALFELLVGKANRKQ